MADWSFAFEDKTKTVLSYANSLSSVSLTMPLNAPATLTGTIAHSSSDMFQIYDRLQVGSANLGNHVCLRAVRDGQTRFWGALTDVQASLADDGTAQVTFTDVAGTLAGATSYTVAKSYKYWTPFLKGNPRWTSTIDSLLSKGQPLVRMTRSGNPTGRVPTNDTLANATGHKKLKGKVWKSSTTTVLEGLQELSGFATGIEWYTTPDATLTVGNTLGSDKTASVMFQFGDGLRNLQAANMQLQPPSNSIFYTDARSGVPKRAASGYDSSSVTAYGEYSSTVNSTTRSNQTDDDRAAARLRTKWRHVVDVVTEPTLAPKPWTDYFLGDTVSVRVVRDSLDLLTNPRVNQIVVNTDEQNREVSHAISFEVI